MVRQFRDRSINHRHPPFPVTFLFETIGIKAELSQISHTVVHRGIEVDVSCLHRRKSVLFSTTIMSTYAAVFFTTDDPARGGVRRTIEQLPYHQTARLFVDIFDREVRLQGTPKEE